MRFIKEYLLADYQIRLDSSIQSPGTQSVNGKKVRKKQGIFESAIAAQAKLL